MRYLILVFVFVFQLVSAQESQKDEVFLANGQKIEGYIMEIKYPHYIRILENDEKLRTYLQKNIDSLKQNPELGLVSDIILLKTEEKISGEILKIQKGGNITFKYGFLSDTLLLADSLIKETKHTKKLFNKHLQKRYLGVYNYFSINPGIGNTYGGLGVKLQVRYGRELGVGIHAGGGLTFNTFWGAGPRYNIGLKLFFLTYFYIDGSYGSIGSYSKKVYPYTSYDEKSFNYNGFSIMAGADYFFNKKFGINVAFGVKLPVEKRNTQWEEAIDIGFIIKFSFDHNLHEKESE